MFSEFGPRAGLSMQTGSFEHQPERRIAELNNASSLSGSPWLTKPPNVPSESPEAV